MKKLTYVVVIDRLDYFSGMNHSFHSLANILHKLGEDVYTFGPGKPGYKYKLLQIEGYDPETSVMPQITDIDLKLNNLDPESTVFISNLFDHPYIDQYKNRVIWIEEFDDTYQFNKDYLYFYHLEGYCRSGHKYDGPIRFFDMDTTFWYPTATKAEYNTFLVKKLFRKNVDIQSIVTSNLQNVARYTNLPFKQMDEIAGLVNHIPGSYQNARPIQRDLWSRSQFFVTFDQITAQCVFAAMCGANPIIIPENDRYTPEEFRELFYPYSSVGVAYGLDDLDHMYKTKNKARQHCKDAYNVYVDDVKNLVKICQEKF
jgi:hypothetical protein